MATKKVQDLTDLRALVELIKNEQRGKVICVITSPMSHPDPVFDVDYIQKETGDLADLYLIQTGDLTRKFASDLSQKAAVFNGAAKIFAPDWHSTEEWPRLYYCSEAYRVRDSETLIDQLWKFASEQDIQRYANLKAIAAEAKVSKILGTRAFVQLADGGLATVRQEVTCPGIPLDWLLPVGSLIHGKYNDAERLFLPLIEKQDLKNIATHYGYGNLALVLIKEVDRKKGIATIFPGLDVPFSLEEISGNERDLVTDFLEPGQVVAMRLYLDAQGRTRLKMNDIDDEEIPVDAAPAISGGPPWLEVDRDIPIEESSAPAPVEVPDVELVAPVEELEPIGSSAPTPQPGSYKVQPDKSEATVSGRKHYEWVAFTTGLTRRLDALQAELGALRAENIAAFNERNALKRKIEEMNRNNTSARRKTASKDPNKSTTRTRRDRWPTNEDWFNEELRRVWISRYKPEERTARYPLDFSKFTYGSMFFDSIFESDLTEDELRKSVRTIVDIVTGRETDSRQNRVHPLRETESPSAPQRVRSDGSKAWRANIEDNTPQARRLHFWKNSSGSYELSKVARHDDFAA